MKAVCAEMRVLTTVLLIALLTWTASALAAEYHATEVQPLAGIKCFVAKEGWFLSSTGPCSGFAGPSSIALGHTFMAEGGVRTIRVIRATQAEEDYEDRRYSLSIRHGEWYCVAAESDDDLGDRKSTRIWLYIAKCAPLR
jgi:hypothetical protein